MIESCSTERLWWASADEPRDFGGSQLFSLKTLLQVRKSLNYESKLMVHDPKTFFSLLSDDRKNTGLELKMKKEDPAAHCYKITIYAPVIYTRPCIMFWRSGYTLRGEVGGGWALEFPSFLGPVKWHRADRRVPFH